MDGVSLGQFNLYTLPNYNQGNLRYNDELRLPLNFAGYFHFSDDAKTWHWARGGPLSYNTVGDIETW